LPDTGYFLPAWIRGGIVNIILVFTKLTNGLQVKHWAICETEFKNTVPKLRDSLTGDGLFAFFGLITFHGKLPPCHSSAWAWLPGRHSMRSRSPALLWAELLSFGPNRDKHSLVSGSRMENKVC
jgi:hypothetical protein